MGSRKLKEIKRLMTVFGKERKNMEYNEANRIEVRYLRVLSNEQARRIAKLEDMNEALKRTLELRTKSVITGGKVVNKKAKEIETLQKQVEQLEKELEFYRNPPMMPLITNSIKACNGKISSNGYCEKCGILSQSSSAYCTRYYKIEALKE